MKRGFIFAVVFCVMACLPALRSASATELPQNITLMTQDGGSVNTTALRDSPLVLMIGSAWCPECRKEAPEFQKAYLAYKDKGVQFLMILCMSKDDDIRDFILTYKITHLIAKDNGLADALGVRPIPQTFFFSKGGKLKKKIFGAAGYRELSANIEKLIAE